MVYKTLRLFLICYFVFLANTSNVFAQTDGIQSLVENGIIAPDTKLILVDSHFVFTEGPAVDRYGNIFFTNQPNDRIWEYDTAGTLSIFLSPAGRSNGMYFDKKGNLISCADQQNQLWSISPEKKITVLLKNYHGHLLNGPNDLWVAPSGGIYITDPYYPRPYWNRKKADTAIGGEKLYYFPAKRKRLTLADISTVKPNGIVGSPDGRYLYVADMGLWKTFRYEIAGDGTLKNKKLFVDMGSDGMTIDDKGNIYLTGNGVMVYDSTGKPLGHLPIPEEWTANICFGGKNKNSLFITASKSVYIIPTLVRGVE